MGNNMSRSGFYETYGENNHFIPNSLPPVPTIAVGKEILI